VKKDKEISQKDIDTWNNYIKNPTDIRDKDKSQKDINLNNFRFKYDLHGHTLAAANIKVKEIISSCVEKNYKEILLITGKGIHSNTDNDIYASKDLSKLRFSVPEYIKSDNDIAKHLLSVTKADKKDGGEGAIIIKLK
jgi:DNA-nicking Smr family endonuclease|tara:strand:- start:221 stop:634 length:414 start_codon:yes stop_codon:yes gene_type:complete